MKIFTHSEIGTRKENQDQFLVAQGNGDFMMLVADGHGNYGAEVAEKALQPFKNHGLIQQSTKEKERETILALFAQSVELTKDYLQSGSTFSGAFKIGQNFYQVSLGDSPIYVFSRNDEENPFGGYVNFSFIQNVDNQDNEESIQAAIAKGGIIVYPYGHKYLCYDDWMLKLTHALGNKVFGPVISLDLRFVELPAKYIEEVIVASDGLTIKQEEIHQLIKNHCPIEDYIAAQKEIGIRDNLTILHASL